VTEDRPILRTDDDPEFPAAMAEADKLHIVVTVRRDGSDTQPNWIAKAEFGDRGRWTENYMLRPKPKHAVGVSTSPSRAVQIAVQHLRRLGQEQDE
jgi:hypothetical protein